MRATQSYRWGVDHFHETEPVRPEFHPTHVRRDPLLNTNDRYYPAYLRLIKYIISASVSLLMVSILYIFVRTLLLDRFNYNHITDSQLLLLLRRKHGCQCSSVGYFLTLRKMHTKTPVAIRKGIERFPEFECGVRT